MSIITVSRDDFIRRYDAKETKLVVAKALKMWDYFLEHKGYAEPDLISTMRQPGNGKYIVLDQLVQFSLQTKYVTTVKTYFGYVKLWIKYNDIELNPDKVKEYVKFPKVVKDRTQGIDRTVVRRILDECDDVHRAVIITAIATGMRIRSEGINLRWSWIKDTDPPTIVIPSQYTKTKQERITFLTPEAMKVLEGIRRHGVDAVFPMTYDGFYTYLKKIRERLGLNARTTSGVFHFKPHRFRGYTENKLSKAIGEEYAHAITGHGNYLGQYFAGGTTDEEAGRDYTKAIKDLTIYDTEHDTAGTPRGAPDVSDTPA